MLADDQVAPIHVAVRGLHIRMIPTADMLSVGYLDLHALRPFRSQHVALLFPDLANEMVAANVDVVDIQSWQAFPGLTHHDHLSAVFDHNDGRVVRFVVWRRPCATGLLRGVFRGVWCAAAPCGVMVHSV